jgi:hypothetical protein
MTRRRFAHLTVMSLATSALIGCQDNTPPTAAVPPMTAPLTELAGVDTTPPVITYTLSGTLGTDNWYTDSVFLKWTVTDPESPVTKSAGTCLNIISYSWGPNSFGCTATSAGGTSSDTATFKIDNLGPRPTLPVHFSTPQSAPGWWNTNVIVAWHCFEFALESGAVDTMPMAIVSTEGRNQAYVAICVDKVGNSRTRRSDDFGGGTISIDKTPPALAPKASPNPVVLNGAATASPNATDALSGVASQSCGPVVTSSVGFKSVSCTAKDSANNTSTKSATYTVLYPFTGLLGLSALPALNAARAGGSISVKFGLGGNRGLNVLAAGSPTSQAISCLTMAATATALKAPTSGNLSYSTKTNTYTYDWRTDKAWVGTCRQLTVKLADGTERKANFQFK